jgi:hypothetical protein
MSILNGKTGHVNEALAATSKSTGENQMRRFIRKIPGRHYSLPGISKFI